jgi:hypothetical protein
MDRYALAFCQQQQHPRRFNTHSTAHKTFRSSSFDIYFGVFAHLNLALEVLYERD